MPPSLTDTSFCVDVLVWERDLAHPSSTTFLPQAALLAQRIALALAPAGGQLFDDPFETCDEAMLIQVYGPQLRPLIDGIAAIVKRFPSWTRVLLDFQTSPPDPHEHLYLWLAPSQVPPAQAYVVLRAPFEGYFNENNSEEMSCLLADQNRLAALGLDVRAWRSRDEDICEIWLDNADLAVVTTLLPRLPKLSGNIGQSFMRPEPFTVTSFLDGRFSL